MDNSFSFVTQLRSCPSAGIAREVTCCKRIYSISLPSGVRITAKGLNSFCFEDGQPLFEARYNQPFCGQPTMHVMFYNFGPEASPLKIRVKGLFSRSLYLCNENDEPVLRLRRPIWVLTQCEIQILSMDGQKIGTIKKDWMEYDVFFPPDLDERYKAALLASCIYMDFMHRRRNH